MIPLNLDKYDEGGISTFENETGETYIDISELCTTMGVEVSAISAMLTPITIGKRDGMDRLIVDEDGFFRAVFLIMEYKLKLYASEIAGLIDKLVSK